VSLGAADDARAWLRPLFDRIADLGAEERAIVAEALALAVPGIGAEWLPRLESACAALPRDGGVALATGCALAERGLWGKARTLLEQAADDPTLAVVPRRKAWIALAELATREGDAARAASAYEAAARLG
jgi:HemY protein